MHGNTSEPALGQRCRRRVAVEDVVEVVVLNPTSIARPVRGDQHVGRIDQDASPSSPQQGARPKSRCLRAGGLDEYLPTAVRDSAVQGPGVLCIEVEDCLGRCTEQIRQMSIIERRTGSSYVVGGSWFSSR